MSVLKYIIAVSAGVTAGIVGTMVAGNSFQRVDTQLSPSVVESIVMPAPWSETDFDSVINEAKVSFVVPSVMLVYAFGDYLLVPNRFLLENVSSEGVRFSTGGILDVETGMTELRLGTIAISDYSASNSNAERPRASNMDNVVNCYGIDIELSRVISQSSDITLMSASLFKDGLEVLVVDGLDHDLWKKLLSRFVEKSTDNGQCLENIDYVDLQIP